MKNRYLIIDEDIPKAISVLKSNGYDEIKPAIGDGEKSNIIIDTKTVSFWIASDHHVEQSKRIAMERDLEKIETISIEQLKILAA